MADREQLTYFPSKSYLLKQVSSYNPASVKKDSAGWFANFDMSHFRGIAEHGGRREFILFDVDGPGAIVRWWMTFYKAQHGIIRIYLDHDSNPVIEGAPRDLLSGDLLADYPFSASVQEGAPVGEKGRDYDHNFYLPIPFSRHARITYECDSLVKRYDYEGIHVPGGFWWPDIFYNICYRDYEKGTNIESFSLEALKKAKSLIDLKSSELLEIPAVSREIKTFEQKIFPGDSLVLKIDMRNSAVYGFSMDLEAADMNQALRSTVISACFDGNRTVWVPVGEFFGMGYIPAPHQTWMNQVSADGLMESWWVMPFREHCRIILINYGIQKIQVKGGIAIDSYDWQPGSMYFGAAWHEHRHIHSRDDKGSPFDLNLIQIRGKGTYVGDMVTLFNNTWHWWGEGDEKIYVDGETFPSSYGTGSEDYYGYSFGRPDPFSHPFLSQPVGIGNTTYGVTVNMRYRSLDGIPFNVSIDADIELWHWADIRMNYAMTTYWYVKEKATINVKPDVDAVRHRVALKKGDIEEIF
jgi:hypothetical protein